MDEKRQNCCLMTTSIEEATGKTMLTYIPLNIDISVVEFFLQNGTCTNNHAISFELEETADEFWQELWGSLEESCE